MSDDNEDRHCYIDHANKKSDAYGKTPYLFWLNQIRRSREQPRQHTAAEDQQGDDD